MIGPTLVIIGSLLCALGEAMRAHENRDRSVLDIERRFR